MKHGKLLKLLKSKSSSMFIALIVFASVTLYYNLVIAAAEFVVIVFLFLFSQVFDWSRNKKINEYLEDLFLSSDSVSKDFAVNSTLPLAIVRDMSGIIWYNNRFSSLFLDTKQAHEANLKDLFNTAPPSFSKEEETISFTLTHGEKMYSALGTNLKVTSVDDKYYTMLYFIDITEQAALKKRLNESHVVFGQIILDNYDEIMPALSDTDRAVLIADTDKHIFNWARNEQAVVKKLEKDKYILLFEKSNIERYIRTGFEKLRDLESESEIKSANLTLSIGIGIDGESPMENEEFCRASVDMALGRGGDQVVIKDKDGFSYYGGQSREIERRTKVRSRVIAQALRELIESKRSVVIMGHKNPDMDFIGSALCIFRAVKNLNKKCYIIIEEVNPSISDIINRINDADEYEDIFVNKYQAETLLSQSGMLAVLDTHRKMLMSYPELLGASDCIVLIDHHRRSADFVENITLTYHEPYASSTAELVIEILQYMDNKIKLTAIESEALYAGILVDTKNFTFKTGVRTFEAASYLRRSGLDPIKAKEMVKCDLPTYQIRSKIVNDASIYKDKIAISNYVGEEIKDLSVIAQAADELINIKGITTTFVLYFDGGICKISARSIGDINVQMIMEKLGGGGHQLSAAAQVENPNIGDVKRRLLECIDEYLSDIKK